MSKLYLITGFLGSGKSTFLKNFIHLFDGLKMQLIINEFGKEGVDGTLLSELGIGLEEIAGGSVFCSCRFDQFEKALHTFVREDTDVVIVESSGLSDPTGVKRLFRDGERYPDIEFMGTICLVDAVRFPKVYAKSKTTVKQIAACDIALINKTDLATEEELALTRSLIEGQRPDLVILQTSFGKVPEDILDMLAASGAEDDKKMPLTADISMRSLTVTVRPEITAYQLKKFVEMFADATFRVKGFIGTADGLMFADCVGNIVTVEPYVGCVTEEQIGKLVVLSGAGMPVVKRVKEAVSWYPELIGEIDME